MRQRLVPSPVECFSRRRPPHPSPLPKGRGRPLSAVKEASLLPVRTRLRVRQQRMPGSPMRVGAEKDRMRGDFLKRSTGLGIMPAARKPGRSGAHVGDEVEALRQPANSRTPVAMRIVALRHESSENQCLRRIFICEFTNIELPDRPNYSSIAGLEVPAQRAGARAQEKN